MKESISLPRIKPTESVQYNPNQHENTELQKVKFKKLQLLEVKQPNVRILRTVKTDRSNSVATLTTVEDRKSVKDKKIQLNLVQKKVRQGNYNERDQISNDLQTLKRKCSEYINESALKNTEIEKIKKKLQTMNHEKFLGEQDANYFAQKVQETKEKYNAIKIKCDDIIHEKKKYSNMILNRKNDNIVITAMIEEKQYQLSRLKAVEEILKRAQIETKQKETDIEIKYKNTCSEAEGQKKLIRMKLDNQQQKLSKWTENQINRDQRNKKYIHITSSVVIEEKEKEFKQTYDQYLAHKFINRFLQIKFNTWIEKNEKTYRLFRQANTRYGPFSPEQYPAKFSNLEPEKEKITEQIKDYQNKMTFLETKFKILKQKSENLTIQYLSLGQRLDEKQSKQVKSEQDLSKKSQRAQQQLDLIQFWCERQLKKLEDSIIGVKTQQGSSSSYIKKKPQKLPKQRKLLKILQYLKLHLLSK